MRMQAEQLLHYQHDHKVNQGRGGDMLTRATVQLHVRHCAQRGNNVRLPCVMRRVLYGRGCCRCVSATGCAGASWPRTAWCWLSSWTQHVRAMRSAWRNWLH